MKLAEACSSRISRTEKAELDILSHGSPNDKALWRRAKERAKEKYNSWKSPYAQAWAKKWYKERGGTWQ